MARRPPTASWFARGLPLDVTAASSARRFSRELLQCYGLHDLADCVQLLVSELVANALKHAEPPMMIRLACDDQVVRVEVDDGSPFWPVIITPNIYDEQGRGLRIVDGMASRWGVERQPVGKTVWFELDVLESIDGQETDSSELSAPLSAPRPETPSFS